MRVWVVIIGLIVTLLFVAFPSNAMLNPSAVYCEALGYNYTVETTEFGEKGLCKLPNGQAVDAWQFLEGKVAQEYSYCKKWDTK